MCETLRYHLDSMGAVATVNFLGKFEWILNTLIKGFVIMDQLCINYDAVCIVSPPFLHRCRDNNLGE